MRLFSRQMRNKHSMIVDMVLMNLLNCFIDETKNIFLFYFENSATNCMLFDILGVNYCAW